MYMPKIENSKERFKDYCRNKFIELYGDNPHEKFTERLNTELGIILEHDHEIPFLIIKYLVDESLKMGYPTFSRGCIGSSFSAFLLGITGINPLNPHYHCHKCKRVEIMQSVVDGYDLPGKLCPVCGTTMKGDGHNIPFVSFSGYNGDKEPDIDINVAPEIQKKTKAILQSFFPNDKIVRAGALRRDGSRGAHPGGYFIIPVEYADEVSTIEIEIDGEIVEVTEKEVHTLTKDFLKIDILGHFVPEKLSILSKETDVILDDIPMNDSDVISLIQSGDTEGIPEFESDFMRNMLQICIPNCFSDLCKISGLSHGTDTWTGNARYLLQDGKAALKNILAFREDVYDYLIKADADYDEAYRIMESVRKGRASRDLDELDLEEYNLPDWFHPCICKIKYMFPKAHGVSYVRMAMQIAWFKSYHNELFNKVLKKHQEDWSQL
jgi:DNA polymerase-3 subunit alpha (Gram-positive type)